MMKVHVSTWRSAYIAQSCILSSFIARSGADSCTSASSPPLATRGSAVLMATANFASFLCPNRVRSATDSLILSSSCSRVDSLNPAAACCWLYMPGYIAP